MRTAVTMEFAFTDGTPRDAIQLVVPDAISCQVDEIYGFMPAATCTALTWHTIEGSDEEEQVEDEQLKPSYVFTTFARTQQLPVWAEGHRDPRWVSETDVRQPGFAATCDKIKLSFFASLEGLEQRWLRESMTRNKAERQGKRVRLRQQVSVRVDADAQA